MVPIEDNILQDYIHNRRRSETKNRIHNCKKINLYWFIHLVVDFAKNFTRKLVRTSRSPNFENTLLLLMQTPENIANPYQPFYNDLFNKINPLGKDVLDSTTIAAFLKTAQGVNVSQLSQIWDLACETSGFTNRGVLNKLGIFICFKFIAAVQQGFPLSPAVLSDPSLEPPRFDTFFQPPLPQQPQSTSFVMTTEKSLSSDWAIGLNDLQKYEAIFDSLGPIDGRLSGNQCRPVLLNSQLPKGILAKIWDLADIDADGFLDRPEFCVALYLVYSALQNDPIPEKLPPTLVPPVKRGIINQTIPREDMPSTHPHGLFFQFLI
ncbi:hypothetical protein Mgra_00004545 [Meloidogyne graminicola]|uniref:Uncharacterized protein n=1 Tax=Meloidogyne graminicola TaxID=189291 RepID=A0A8S9ZRR8_9BILA|nr:hypothetical protein Mgra_00004545 [Meloidogyne graminicola]